MIKQVIIGATLLLALASVPAVSLYAKTDKDNGPKKDIETHKIVICHATDSVTNPYNEIEVDVDSTGKVYDNGNGDHMEHEGPVATSQAVAQAIKDNRKEENGKLWGDIIPAGPYTGAGLNAIEGKAVLANHCQYPTAPTVPETPGTPVTPVTPDEPGKGDFTPTPVVTNETPAPSTTQPVVATDVEALPYTAGDHTFAYTLIAAGLATVVIGLGVSLKSLYRHSA